MIVKEVPAPSGNINHPTQALIFDSFYDSYRGVVVFVRIKEGSIKVGDTIKFMATGATYEVTELGVRTPAEVKKDELVCGEILSFIVDYIQLIILSIKIYEKHWKKYNLVIRLLSLNQKHRKH